MELEVWEPPGSQTTLRKMFRIKIEALKKMRTPALEVTIQSFRKQVSSSFKVQLLQPSMCCSSKGGDFGLGAPKPGAGPSMGSVSALALRMF